ncbi:conserved protein, unknown function [Hepatocystis sp. ex Piliocolobus tephrosceles]|nr:conserved protein, unknown function [Hepatocystis sp. ex Piliocolobus tephrosceles]
MEELNTREQKCLPFNDIVKTTPDKHLKVFPIITAAQRDDNAEKLLKHVEILESHTELQKKQLFNKHSLNNLSGVIKNLKQDVSSNSPPVMNKTLTKKAKILLKHNNNNNTDKSYSNSANVNSNNNNNNTNNSNKKNVSNIKHNEQNKNQNIASNIKQINKFLASKKKTNNSKHFSIDGKYKYSLTCGSHGILDDDSNLLKQIQKKIININDNLHDKKNIKTHNQPHTHKYNNKLLYLNENFIKLKDSIIGMESSINRNINSSYNNHNKYSFSNFVDEEKPYFKNIRKQCKKIVNCLNCNYDMLDIKEVVDTLDTITNPNYDERFDKNEYLKLFIDKYHYVYPYENIKGLRQIRKFVENNYKIKKNFYINEEDISYMYLKTDLEKIIKNDHFVNNMLNLNINNGKFWIQLVHNIWIPLILHIFNSTQNSFYSYFINYSSDFTVLDQYVYSKRDTNFYKFSHHIFTGILFSGVPSIYRLLMRLHAYKYIETRINMILEKNHKNIYNEGVISSLNYNMDIIRTLFPFFKEFVNINMEHIVEKFFESRFFNIVISSLKKKNIKKVIINTKYITFVNSFFLMITEFLYGVIHKKIIEKINENKIKIIEKLNYIFYDNMNMYIARDILLFIADLLCLYKLNSIYIKKKYCNIILNITNIIKNYYYKYKSSITYTDDCNVYCNNMCNPNYNYNQDAIKQVYVIAIKINHFIKSALQRKQTVNENMILQELTIINRYYMNDLKKQENNIGDFFFLKNINYGIYCWNPVCNKYVNAHNYDYNKNTFQYCQGCYIATYCSEKCKLIHLLASHYNICVYFKTIPSFLKFNTTNVDYGFTKMKYLNIFEHIDTYDRQNEKYQIIY